MRPEVAIAVDWAIRCFGFAHVRDQKVRALRCVEETLELAQACFVDKKTLHELVDFVYARTRGSPMQEMGGVLMTAYVMSAGALSENPDKIFERELRRVLDLPIDKFRKRNQEKLDAGFVGKHSVPANESAIGDGNKDR